MEFLQGIQVSQLVFDFWRINTVSDFSITFFIAGVIEIAALAIIIILIRTSFQ